MSTVRLDPALARVLGLPEDTKSPDAIVVAMFREQASVLRTLANRAAHRCKLTRIKIHDGDPSRPGDQTAYIDVRTNVVDDVGRQAMKFAALALYSPAAGMVILDEAARMMTGQGEGPPASALDADSIESSVDPQTLAILGPGARNLFGIDDAILLGAGVTLLVAILPVVLPMLLALGKSAIDLVVPHSAPPAEVPAGDAPSGGAFPGSELFDQAADAVGVGKAGVDDSMTGILMVAAIGVGIWFLLRKKG